MKTSKNSRKSLKKNTSNTPVKYYSGIEDISLYNFMKCASGDYRYARIVFDLRSEATKQDEAAWDVIMDTRIEKYGLQKDYMEYLKLRVKISEAQLQYLVDNSRRAQNAVRLFEVKLKDLETKMSWGISYEKTLVILSEKMKMILNAKEITADFYFNAIDLWLK